MLGLVLEGGGSRGSYHIGVIKAYYEFGYIFDGFVGTSIGAINAAVLAQNDFKKAEQLWLSLSMEQLFDTDESNLISISQLKMNANFILNMKNSLKKIIEGHGVNTEKMKVIVGEFLDEDKIRDSKKDFGLVTVSINERKPYEMYLEDIPEGQLLNYIMASACFPGFKSEVINGNSFIDGSLYDNCPTNMLIKKNYNEIIIIRTSSTGHIRKLLPNNASIKTIIPSEDLGNMLIFSPERIQANINRGYFDGIRSIKGLLGAMYYIKPDDSEDFMTMLMSISDESIESIATLLSVTKSQPKRMLFEKIIPKLAMFLKLQKEFDYQDFVIGLLEYAAEEKAIERYKIYGFKEFLELIKSTPEQTKKATNSIVSKYMLAKNNLNKNISATKILLSEII